MSLVILRIFVETSEGKVYYECFNTDHRFGTTETRPAVESPDRCTERDSSAPQWLSNEESRRNGFYSTADESTWKAGSWIG